MWGNPRRAKTYSTIGECLMCQEPPPKKKKHLSPQRKRWREKETEIQGCSFLGPFLAQHLRSFVMITVNYQIYQLGQPFPWSLRQAALGRLAANPSTRLSANTGRKSLGRSRGIFLEGPSQMARCEMKENSNLHISRLMRTVCFDSFGHQAQSHLWHDHVPAFWNCYVQSVNVYNNMPKNMIKYDKWCICYHMLILW